MDLIYKKLNRMIGFILFGVASLVYIITSEPTTSFWDCGEYIATAFKLQVGHPPGAPIFQLLGRFFSLFAFGDTSQVARMINTMSALSSGLTIAFLFWTITMLAKKLLAKMEMTRANLIAIFGSGVVGALAFTFSDSFWFSAVEGEVYAMSTLFTAMTFWAILKWEAVAGEPYSYRWLILIAYLIGVSIGVHLLNLLAIPAITFVFFYKNYNIPGWKGFFLALGISFLLVALILYGIVPEIVSLFANTELFFVNTLGLPFNSGTYFFILLLVALIVFGLLYTHSDNKLYPRIIIGLGAVTVVLFMLETSSAGNFFGRLIAASAVVGLFYMWRNRKALLNNIIIAFVFILVGYASFFTLVIRSNANPPIDENNPENAISLLAYLNREQYGSFPIFHGQYYNAPLIDREDGKPVYKRDDASGKYIVWDSREGTVPVYDPEYTTIFPRMWNNQEDRYIQDYKNWAGIRNDPDNKHIPTFSENLRYFFRYQVNHMYIRYFFWNFVGRQNDNQGMYADLLNGNWISGIGFIDKMRLGPQDVPGSMSNEARNTFFLLPLLAGILGLLYQFGKNAKDGTVVLLLFIMTGLAITIYLNQHSPQPRERDYAYAASFYAFTIWIGLGVLWLYELLQKKLSHKIAAITASAAMFLLVPVIMMAQGWGDHDRSGRYTALEVAKNYLNSCEKNAILFTNGDNDTFPLWYAQEVEGIRTDVRVCNLSLLNTDWYIDQMLRKAYDSDPLPFTLPETMYKNGSHDVTYLLEEQNPNKEFIEVKAIFDRLKKNEKIFQVNTGRGMADYFPTKTFRITVDPAVAVSSGTVPAELAGQVTDLEWRISANALTKNYLMMLDLLAHNNWQRPVYYVSTTSRDAYIGLDNYLRLEGFAYRLVPIRQTVDKNETGGVNTDAMYDNLMNRFEFNINKPGLLVSEDIYRMTVTMRSTYSRLIDALIAENKPARAVEVCDRIQTLIPGKKVPYNYFNLSVADGYLKAGEADKGREILQELLRIQEDQLGYFFSFGDKHLPLLEMDIQQGVAVLSAVAQVAESNGQDDLAEEADASLNRFYELYLGRVGN
ncbi:MAG TPA: MFS transporter [Bacteroidales bacterium]|nr:MFS transporter [Bacteroidales bacterium]HPI85830.1 MFS transporter [Bacteroidales bacterium]HPM92043.1 MFS transporter [Bacteroidales bacterium]